MNNCLQNFQMKAILPFLLFFFALGCTSTNQVKQQNTAQKAAPNSTLPRLRDEFSELDDAKNVGYSNNNYVSSRLEAARQHYLRALAYIDRADTLRAGRSFEQAMSVLNSIVNFPNIESNAEFSDLTQSVIEDYESYIQSIDNLDENSSIFILREKFFEELDASSSMTGVSQKDTNLPKVISLQVQEQIPPVKGGEVHKVTGTPGQWQIALDDNEFVSNSVKFFTETKGRKFFKRWLERAGKWFPMMRKIAKEEGVPQEIVYLSMIESALNPKAVSRASAVGLWQFIRSTGELYGLQINYWMDERRDPEKSTRAAMRHLRDLYAQLGDWHLVFAAYNRGLGGVRRTIDRSGKENATYWEIRNMLPKETRNYVPLFIATAKIAQNPEGYEFNDLQFEPEYQYEVFPISESVDLSVLARCAGVTKEALEELNPELIYSCIPPNTMNYPLKLPVGVNKQTFADNYRQVPDDAKRSWALHEVKKNETLQAIATRYGSSAQMIMAVNELQGKKVKLRPGTLLRVPIGPNASATLPTTEIAEEAKPAKETEKSTVSPSENRKKIVHRVSKGETLHNIAKRYGVRIADVRNWNDIPYNSDDIQLDSDLTIYVEKESLPVASTPVETKRTKVIKHKVRSGETIAKIADDYDISVESVRSLNKLGKKDKLQVGQTLSIPATASTANSRNEEPSVARSKIAVTHRVKKGETLTEIAEMYGVERQDLVSWNRKTIKGGQVMAGTSLTVYSSTTVKGSAPRSEGKAPKTYKIRQGDTLAAISRKFGVSVAQLQKLNKNLKESSLQIGQSVRIQ